MQQSLTTVTLPESIQYPHRYSIPPHPARLPARRRIGLVDEAEAVGHLRHAAAHLQDYGISINKGAELVSTIYEGREELIL